MTVRNLDFLFRPRSVAVIGASNRAHTVGATVIRNLLKGTFQGPIWPVNPKSKSVAGVHAYRDVFHLPETPDLALLCTPAETLPQAVHEIGVRGTRAIAILASTLHAPAEPGKPSQQQSLLSAAQPHLLRILGPNSMGLMIPGLGLDASFFPIPAQPGHIALVSQSGALTAAALNWGASRNIGFSHVVSLGDAADVDAADALDYLGSIPDTHAVLLYIESVRNARKFLSTARAASRNKPIIVMKSGRTPEGAEAAMRHTGCHPGNDAVFDAAIRRAGMLRVRTTAELFAAAETLSRMRMPVGERLLILTNAGGPGVIATDTLISHGGELAPLASETAEKIAPYLPAASSAANPVDIGGDATPTRYAETLKILLNEPGSDALLLIHGPSGIAAGEEIAVACAELARDSPRNVLACWMEGERARRSIRPLQEAGIAVHDAPEAAAQAFVHSVDYCRSQEALQEAPSSIPVDFIPDRAAVKGILQHAAAGKHSALTDPEGKALLAAYGIPTLATHVAATSEDAVNIALQIGYPVALKVVSPELEHRADVGGVMLNLENADEVRRAAMDISQRMQTLRPDATLSGFTVQRMVRRPGAVHLRHGGHELVLEATEDSIFGPVIYLRANGGRAPSGTAVGLVPLNGALAYEMLTHAHLSAVLTGTRDRPTPDFHAIATVLTRVSQLLVDLPEIVDIRIDPLLCDDKGAVAVEVRIRAAFTKRKGNERLAIQPYPAHLERSIDLSGRRLLVRPIRPEDARLYSQFLARTEDPDIRFRFFTLQRSLPARDLARYTQIDYDRDMAFVALTSTDEGSDEIVGEVRALKYPDGATAEFSVLVRTDMKRLGLGRTLLQVMIDYCKASGIAELVGQILKENQPMIALARRCGMTVELPPGAAIAVAHLDLRPPPADAAQLF
jgi:acetyltransferase